jgi:hypothetical protein
MNVWIQAGKVAYDNQAHARYVLAPPLTALQAQ